MISLISKFGLEIIKSTANCPLIPHKEMIINFFLVTYPEYIYNFEDKKIKKKEYFIPYQIEKFNLVKKFHENTIHKRAQTLYESIKQSNFWWVGIYQDAKNYVKNYSICQQVHKLKARKPKVKQIIVNCPILSSLLLKFFFFYMFFYIFFEIDFLSIHLFCLFIIIYNLLFLIYY